MEQKTALRILKTGENVFLTGAAGTGKTYVLHQFIKWLYTHRISVAITASTGIASSHIAGQTIHSWSGIGIRETLTRKDCDTIARKKVVRERIESTHVLIIDEMSMISRQTLEALDELFRFIRLSNAPFGGMQVVVCGDFFQLPPVSKTPIPNTQKFAFMSPLWGQARFQVCYLKDQFRQNEDDLAGFLDEIRSGEVSDSRINQLQECIERTQEETPEQTYTKLYTHNIDVDTLNEKELNALPSPGYEFVGMGSGDKSGIEILMKSVLVPHRMVLKKGAPVMFIKNNPKVGYHNGTLGTITDFTSEGFPVVTTRDDRDIYVTQEEWSIRDRYGTPQSTYSHIPLRLAWAITVHKSQGMTLDEAEMDLSKTFETGQGYVALSRVRNWRGLRLLGCNSTALQIDPLVLQADKRFQELSQDGEQNILNTDSSLIEKRIEDRRLSQENSMKEEEMPLFLSEKKKVKIKKSVVKPEPQKKVSTYSVTKSLLLEKKPIESIMEARGMNYDTIIKHIEHLVIETPDLDIDYLRPEKKDMAKMTMGFIQAEQKATAEDRDKDGHVKLKLVFETLNESYFYNDLKIARLFLLDRTKN